MQPAISVRDLTRGYPSGVQVGPLTFDVPRGVITGLVGPNGVGKTTTIRMLLGLIRPDGGDVLVLDAASWSDLPMVLDRVGALVDGPSLVPTLTGRANLLMLSRLAGWPATNVDAALELVGLADRADRRVREYSLGMRQRLALAGALLGEPDLLIVDEPANGLDPQGVAELRVLLAKIAAEGTTIVVSSHVLSEVEQVCHHLVVMAEHGIAFHGSREELAGRLQSSLLVDVATSPTREDDCARLCGVLREHGFVAEVEDHTITITITADQPESNDTAKVAVELDGALINTIAHETGIVLARIEPRRQSLEDIFFELTGAPGSTADRLGSTLSVDSADIAANEHSQRRRWRPGRTPRASHTPRRARAAKDAS